MNERAAFSDMSPISVYSSYFRILRFPRSFQESRIGFESYVQNTDARLTLMENRIRTIEHAFELNAKAKEEELKNWKPVTLPWMRGLRATSGAGSETK